MTKTVSIIGKGAFGSALSHIYRDAGADPTVYGRALPKEITTDYVFLAVPSHAVPQVASAVSFSDQTVVVLCSKGFLSGGALPSAHLPKDVAWAVLSGPGFADELIRGLPTVHAIASTTTNAEHLATELSRPNFRLYWSDDPVGTQVCGALKNVLAIATGICDALDLGENARASLITRGANEIRQALVRFGGQERTLWSPAGIGDLILTCTSAKSRNFRFGQMIASGHMAAKAQAALETVEGVYTVRALLAAAPIGEMPIATALAQVIEGELSPQAAIEGLMGRPISAA